MTTAAISQIYSLFLKFPKVTTDTRKDLSGSIFFSLKGENFDANKFAKTALENGAEYAVIDNPDYKVSDKYILVKDTLDTLQKLANFHRKKLKIPIIGITGSNGKTTSKELLNAVLSTTYKTKATVGNLNNHIGVPLTILSIKKDDEIAIVEMGANHIGEIAQLCIIAQPTHGIITNIGKAHLEGFGSFEGVKKAKSELYEYLRKNQGIVFTNSSDKLLMELSEGMERFLYGEEDPTFCKGKILNLIPYIKLQWECSSRGLKGTIESNLLGHYNFVNLLSSICIGAFFKIDAHKINSALSEYEPKNNRSQLIQTKTNKIILDAYNANPSSMSAAIQTCSRNFDQDVYFIIGDMFELGEESKVEHKNIHELLASIPTDQVLLIGKHFKEFEKEGKFLYFESREKAEDYLKQNPPNNKVILIKGSRGMELEKLLPLLP